MWKNITIVGSGSDSVLFFYGNRIIIDKCVDKYFMYESMTFNSSEICFVSLSLQFVYQIVYCTPDKVERYIACVYKFLYVF